MLVTARLVDKPAQDASFFLLARFASENLNKHRLQTFSFMQLEYLLVDLGLSHLRLILSLTDENCLAFAIIKGWAPDMRLR